MKSSSILTALTTVALASVTHGIQSRLPFTGTSSPIGSLSKQSQLLLHVRGGEQEIVTENDDIITEEGMETVIETDMAEDGVIVEETPVTATPVGNNAIMSMLLPIKSAIENAGFFYINSFNSYPIQTITLTAVVVVLLISILSSVFGSTNADETVSTPTQETKKVATAAVSTPASPVSIPRINSSLPSGVGSRSLITGLGTAAATTFAIFQAVNRPPSEEEGHGRSNLLDEDDEDGEHGGTVFKAQELLLTGQRLMKNVYNQLGDDKESSEEDLYCDEDSDEALS